MGKMYRVNLINKANRLIEGTIWMNGECIEMYNSDTNCLFKVEKVCSEEAWKRAEREKAKRVKEERKRKSEEAEEFWNDLWND